MNRLAAALCAVGITFVQVVGLAQGEENPPPTLPSGVHLEALEKPPSLEYKRRVEDLLHKLAVPGALSLAQEQMRLRRMMMVLEYIADAPSVDLLERLSKQGPEDALCDEARASLLRLGKEAPAKTAGP